MNVKALIRIAAVGVALSIPASLGATASASAQSGVFGGSNLPTQGTKRIVRDHRGQPKQYAPPILRRVQCSRHVCRYIRPIVRDHRRR
ncbi:MAG TPA: hypothetical protein VM325_03275 [Alphaproteobacteria bacterium]|nr:hypothetical protein [Alphaproteobacteria bacterium]